MKFLKLNAKNRNIFWFFGSLLLWFIPNRISVENASSDKLKNLSLLLKMDSRAQFL